jgi:hypothetical protein
MIDNVPASARRRKAMTPAEPTGSLWTSFDLYEVFVLHRLRQAVRDLAGPGREVQDGELASEMISATSATNSSFARSNRDAHRCLPSLLRTLARR